MKWKKELEKLGIKEDNLSQGLKKKIKDFNVIVQGLKEAEQSLTEIDENDPAYGETVQTISDLKEALSDADERIVKNIQYVVENKDRLADQTKKMQESRAAKIKERKESKKTDVNETPISTADQIPNTEPIVSTNTQQPPVSTKPDQTTTETVKAEPIKKENSSGAGWLIFGVVAFAVTLGAVNFFKNRG